MEEDGYSGGVVWCNVVLKVVELNNRRVENNERQRDNERDQWTKSEEERWSFIVCELGCWLLRWGVLCGEFSGSGGIRWAVKLRSDWGIGHLGSWVSFGTWRGRC